MYYTRRSKYQAKKTEYGGFLYASKLEAGTAQDLDLMLKAKEIAKVERQKRFDLIVNGDKICTYVADFLVHHHDGSQEVWEPKGLITPVARLKLLLFNALYPNIKLTLIFARQNNYRIPKRWRPK